MGESNGNETAEHHQPGAGQWSEGQIEFAGRSQDVPE
jgi:hypothetical protein